jgi:hypothetical protein
LNYAPLTILAASCHRKPLAKRKRLQYFLRQYIEISIGNWDPLNERSRHHRQRRHSKECCRTKLLLGTAISGAYSSPKTNVAHLGAPFFRLRRNQELTVNSMTNNELSSLACQGAGEHVQEIDKTFAQIIQSEHEEFEQQRIGYVSQRSNNNENQYEFISYFKMKSSSFLKIIKSFFVSKIPVRYYTSLFIMKHLASYSNLLSIKSKFHQTILSTSDSSESTLSVDANFSSIIGDFADLHYLIDRIHKNSSYLYCNYIDSRTPINIPHGFSVLNSIDRSENVVLKRSIHRFGIDDNYSVEMLLRISLLLKASPSNSVVFSDLVSNLENALHIQSNHKIDLTIASQNPPPNLHARPRELFKSRKDKSEDAMQFLQRVWGDLVSTRSLYQFQLQKMDNALLASFRSYCNYRGKDPSDTLPSRQDFTQYVINNPNAVAPEMVQRAHAAIGRKAYARNSRKRLSKLEAQPA